LEAVRIIIISLLLAILGVAALFIMSGVFFVSVGPQLGFFALSDYAGPAVVCIVGGWLAGKCLQERVLLQLSSFCVSILVIIAVHAIVAYLFRISTSSVL
jgi:hypothetical protein